MPFKNFCKDKSLLYINKIYLLMLHAGEDIYYTPVLQHITNLLSLTELVTENGAARINTFNGCE